MVFKTTISFSVISCFFLFSVDDDDLFPFGDFFLDFLDFLELLFFGLPFEVSLFFFLPPRPPFLRFLSDFPFVGFGVEILECILPVFSLLFGVTDADVVGTKETFNPGKLMLSPEDPTETVGTASDLSKFVTVLCNRILLLMPSLSDFLLLELEQFKQRLDSMPDVSSGLLFVFKLAVGKGAN